MQEILKKRMKEWRRDIHKHPELGFNEKRTSEKIALILKEIGLDVFTGIGKTVQHTACITKKKHSTEFFILFSSQMKKTERAH